MHPPENPSENPSMEYRSTLLFISDVDIAEIVLPTSNKDEKNRAIGSDFIIKFNIPMHIEKKTMKEVVDRELKPADLIEDTISKFCLVISSVF